MFERDDNTLIKQALNGKKSAWITLVKRYEKGIYNYCFRMVGNGEDAKDLMQDVFLAVFRNLSNFRGDSQFKNWLFRIANYRCIEHYRKKRPNESLDDSPEVIDETSVNCPVHQLNLGQQASELINAMQRLPVNQRSVVELKFFQHHTFEQISDQLGVSINTVKTRLYSALNKLKGHLEVHHVE